MKQEFLNEENYQRISKKLLYLGIGIIILGVVIALLIVIVNIIGGGKTNKEELQQQLNEITLNLERRYAELESNGFEESMDYKNREGYEMFLIDTALNPTYDTCESSTRYSDNDTTREYCKIKAQLNKLDEPSSVSMFPAFMILMSSLSFGAMFIFAAKRREIAAFHAQQVMPVAQEGIEKMTPTLGKAGSSIAKEISKGIKEGLNDNEKK